MNSLIPLIKILSYKEKIDKKIQTLNFNINRQLVPKSMQVAFVVESVEYLPLDYETAVQSSEKQTHIKQRRQQGTPGCFNHEIVFVRLSDLGGNEEICFHRKSLLGNPV